MQREVDIREISDGYKYYCNDMARIGCNDCHGCSSCCENMNGLIALDPYDFYRLVSGDKDFTFDNLLNINIELIVDRGILVPTLKMREGDGKCTFLSEGGRCSIHSVRPGICRLFPMGRLYEEGSFYYFLQKDECNYPGKTKVKIKKWLETPDISKYEKYINDWHYFIMDIREYISKASDDEINQINTILLKIFFISPYADDFYTDFYNRLNRVKELL